MISQMVETTSGQQASYVSIVQHATVSFGAHLPSLITDAQLASSVEEATCGSDATCSAAVASNTQPTLRSVSVTTYVSEMAGAVTLRRRLSQECPCSP